MPTDEERIQKMEHEVYDLRKKVHELEDAIFKLDRTVWALKKQETQRKIDEYLENYKPKTK